MRQFISYLASFYLLFCCSCSNDPQQNSYISIGKPWLILELDSSKLLVSEVLRDLEQPFEITWASDEHLWFTERKGNVYRMNPKTAEKKKVLSISDAYSEGNTPGLLGMVVHPDFMTEPFVYTHYTYMDSSIVGEFDRKGRPNMIRSRIVRYRYNQEKDTLITPEIILANIQGTRSHNGSRLIISSDKKILFAIGDASDNRTAQDKFALTGKVLRMNLDGSIPKDNPIPGSYSYSIGHRNQQGLVEANGKFYTSEHGPNNDDELNLILAAGNYGWPNVEGYCDTESELNFCDTIQVQEPLFSWTPTIAPAGLDYYNHPSIPEWKNSLLLTTLKGRSLQFFQLDDSGTKIEEHKIYLQKQFGRLRDLCVSSTGDIYLISSNTDWHIPRYKWMYDNVPADGNDRIIKISAITQWDDDYNKLQVYGEDTAQIRMFVQDQVDPNVAGASLYQTNCAPCHLPDGKGIAEFTPPLIDTKWVSDKVKLIEATLFGLTGEIEVKGALYDEIMPGFATSLNDKEVVEILNFVLSSLNNYEHSVTEEEVSTTRKGQLK
ncbi:MAG: PQQ-dependent sugar dehydrogenase [Bacteroidia bacterium]